MTQVVKKDQAALPYVPFQGKGLDFKIASDYDPDAEVVYYHGDCLDLLSRVPNHSVQLCICSPPYNIGKPYEKKIDIEDYKKKQDEVISKCLDKLTDNGSICWEVGNYVENSHIVPLDVLLYPLFVKHEGVKLRNRIIWSFGHGMHASKRFSGRYETILWFTKSDNYIFDLDAVRVAQKYPYKKYFRGPRKGELSGNPLGKNPTDVWEIPNVKANHPEKTIHPCQFPVELVERLVLALTDKKGVVLDPYMGVASSAIASLMHGRKVIGAEMRADYVKIGKTRLVKLRNGELKVRPMWRQIPAPLPRIKQPVGDYGTLDKLG
jgi:adenine-specific DNA-methyltransferase